MIVLGVVSSGVYDDDGVLQVARFNVCEGSLECECFVKGYVVGLFWFAGHFVNVVNCCLYIMLSCVSVV